MTATLHEDDARSLQECVAAGGVAVFPSDTVYGLCCDPDEQGAARRLYQLKGRPPTRAELDLGTQLLAPAGDALPWERCCHLILCTNEFVYLD